MTEDEIINITDACQIISECIRDYSTEVDGVIKNRLHTHTLEAFVDRRIDVSKNELFIIGTRLCCATSYSRKGGICTFNVFDSNWKEVEK